MIKVQEENMLKLFDRFDVFEKVRMIQKLLDVTVLELETCGDSMLVDQGAYWLGDLADAARQASDELAAETA